MVVCTEIYHSTRYAMIKIFVLFFPLSVAPPSRFSWVVRNVLKGAMWGLLGYACFRASKGVGRALLSLPTVQSLFENIRTPSVWPFSKRHRLFSSEIRMSHWTPVALTTGWWLGRLGGRLKANIISISYEISNVDGSLWLALSHLLNPLCTCGRRAVLPKKSDHAFFLFPHS